MIKKHLRGILFLAVAGYAAWTIYGHGDEPGEIDTARARSALELHYIAADIYSPVRCTATSDNLPEPRTWILCRGIPSNGTTGGLYTFDRDDQGTLRIWAVNGRAIQHIGGRNGAILSDENSIKIPAAAWDGAPLDIQGALSLF